MTAPLIIRTMQLAQLARISVRPVLLAFASRCSFSSSSSTTPTAEATTRVLRIGDVLGDSKRFSESDVSGYSSISGDRNPIHFDDAFARAVAGFDRGRIVHGMLVASLFSTLMATHFPGAVYVSQTLKFKLPVYIGEEVHAEIQATNIRKRNDKYIVFFATKCFTAEDSLVVDGEATSILPTLSIGGSKS